MSDTVENGNLKPRVRFVADGIISDFLFNFVIFENENLDVYIDDKLTTIGFNILQNSDGKGGKVCFDTAPEAGRIITLIRNLEFKRMSDFQESGAFRAKVINHELDYQVASLQQLDEKISRTVTFPPYAPTQLDVSLPMPEAGKAIVWNKEGNSLENSLIAINDVISNIEAAIDSCTSEAQLAQSHAQQSAISANEAGQKAMEAADCVVEAAQFAQNAAASADSSQNTATEIDEKIAEVTALFDAKANLNLDNLTSGGKKVISALIMPNFSAGIARAPGQTFQAATDGWLWLQGKAVHGDSYGYIGGNSSNVNKLIYRTEYSAGYWSNLNMTFTPVPKGWYYRTSGNFDQITFYPCSAG